jgi:Ino eighty subunit 1
VFTRTEISSASRARAFLWLCFNYLENPGSASDDYDEEEKPNPFADPAKDSAPALINLTAEEAALENVDTPEEKELAEKLVANRDQIVKANAAIKVAVKESEKDITKPDDEEQSPAVEEPKAKGRKKAGRAAADKPEKPKRGGRGNAEKLRKEALKKGAKGSQSTTPRDGMSVDGGMFHAATSMVYA